MISVQYYECYCTLLRARFFRDTVYMPICVICRRRLMPFFSRIGGEQKQDSSAFCLLWSLPHQWSLTFLSPEAIIIVPHQMIWSWYIGRWWVGCYMQGGGASPSCTKCNSPPINGKCTNHRIAVQWSVALRF